jgi:hypothetical protein
MDCYSRNDSSASSWAMYTVRELPILAAIQPLSQFLGISIGTEKGRVPWAELQRAQGDYIKPKYLPKKVTLKQYYHLRQEDVNAILEHWAQRQAAGKVPFRFRKAAKTIRKKRTLEGSDADVDMGSGEEAEEDLQDDNGIQSQADGELQADGSSNGSNKRAHPARRLGNAAENLSRVGSLLKHGDSRR